MELKTNYQYTYFVHPFAVKQNKYKKYLQKLLKDKNCSLKTFQKEKDLQLYKYFTPKVRDFMFSSFSLSKSKINKLKEMPIETQSAVLAGYPCTIFEYVLFKDIQGKAEEAEGIFFKIQKLEIICFNTGICFLAIKTNVENSNEFRDTLNFNYKFRDIKQEGINLNEYDKIRLQTDSFSDVETFTDFIRRLTGSSAESMKLDIDTERFLTYSYVCIDSRDWNNEKNFDGLETKFIKFSNVLPADSNINFIKNEAIALSKWKYAKLGITKFATTLFTSSAALNNYTILPTEFENEYFYTYILNLYKKICLKRIDLEFKKADKIKSTRKKFIDFTKNLWIQESTEDEIGTVIDHKFREAFEVEEMYYKVKNKYDIFYKELNIERERKTTMIIAAVLVVTLVFNILNFIVLTYK